MYFDRCMIGLFVISAAIFVEGAFDGTSFDVNYDVTYGNDHILFLIQKTEAQLSLDVNSGAGFGSKQRYGSGFFHIRMKLPNKDSAGVVTTFYLISNTNHHDELDIEFLGNREGKPITLQTNVFVNGEGNKEQRTLLWFDPTADFHSYKIMWNEHQIVFYVDDTPIRVFKNLTSSGVGYPSQPMQIQGTLWNGDWATDGGQTKIDWAHAPFIAHYQGFTVDACPLAQPNMSSQNCYSSGFWWNQNKYWKLNKEEQKAYELAKQKYMNYDYCTDRNRYHVVPPECKYNT